MNIYAFIARSLFTCLLLFSTVNTIADTPSKQQEFSQAEMVYVETLLKPPISQRVLQLLNDKDFILAAVRWQGMALEFAHPDLRKDKDIVLAAIQQNGMALQFSDYALRKDRKLVLSAIYQNAKALQFADHSLRSDKELVLSAVRRDNQVFKYATLKLRRDKQTVLEAVTIFSGNLESADLSLENKKSLILSLVQKKPSTCDTLFFSAGKHLKNDKGFILHLLRKAKCAGIFYDLNKHLWQDKEIVLFGVQRFGSNLANANTSLRNDRRIVMAAVKQDGDALQYASARLKNDKSVVYSAIQQSSYAFLFASPSLRKDKNIMALFAAKRHQGSLLYAQATEANRSRVLEAVKKRKIVLAYVRDEFKRDRDIVLAAVKKDGYSLRFAHKELQKDEEIVEAALKSLSKYKGVNSSKKRSRAEVLANIKKNKDAYAFLEERFHKDKEIVLASIEVSESFGYYHFDKISKRLKKDQEVIWALINKAINGKRTSSLNEKDPFNLLKYLHYISKPIKNKTRLLRLLRKQGLALQYASTRLKKDRDVVRTAIKQNGEALAYADIRFKRDRAVVSSAVRQSAEAFFFAHKALKTDSEILRFAILGKNTLSYLYGLLDKKSAKLIRKKVKVYNVKEGYYYIQKFNLSLKGIPSFYKEGYAIEPRVVFNKNKTKIAAILTLKPTNKSIVAVWNKKTGRLLYKTALHESWPSSYSELRFTPNSRRLVSVYQGDQGFIWNFTRYKKPIYCSMGSSIIDISNKSVLVHPADNVDGLYDLDTCKVIAKQRDMAAPKAKISSNNKILMVIPKGSMSKDKKNYYLYQPTEKPTFLLGNGHFSDRNYPGKVIIKEVRSKKRVR